MINQLESMTAKLCAFTRAWHSNKGKDKIFDDYLAYDMMGKEEYEYVYRYIQKDLIPENKDYSKEEVEQLIKTYLAPIVLPRAKFTEERLQSFSNNKEHLQYVICGAGSDTFSFRNTNANIDIYEVDHPSTQFYKRKRIAELEWITPSNVHFVSVDFQKEKLAKRLVEQGFDIEKPTFFSILGVTYYLSLPVFTDTLQQIASISAKNSVVAFDFPEKRAKRSLVMEELETMTKRLGETMQGGYKCEEVKRILKSLGFEIDTMLTPNLIQSFYLSDREEKLKAFETIHFLSATQQNQINEKKGM